MKIEVLGVAGDQILMRFTDKEYNPQMNIGVWLNPPEAEKVIFELQNFLHEQYNHLDAEQRAQE